MDWSRWARCGPQLRRHPVVQRRCGAVLCAHFGRDQRLFSSLVPRSRNYVGAGRSSCGRDLGRKRAALDRASAIRLERYQAIVGLSRRVRSVIVPRPDPRCVLSRPHVCSLKRRVLFVLVGCDLRSGCSGLSVDVRVRLHLRVHGCSVRVQRIARLLLPSSPCRHRGGSWFHLGDVGPLLTQNGRRRRRFLYVEHV